MEINNSLRARLRRWFKHLKHNIDCYGFLSGIFYNFRNYFPFRQLDNLYYWIKFRTWAKYHVVNSGMPPGWHDITELMIHVNFQMLVNFIEKERAFETVVWDSPPEHARAKKELEELYHWWKNVYPKYDDNNPLYKTKHPERKFEPIEVDKDGDPLLFSWEANFESEEAKEAYHKTIRDGMDYEVQCDKEIENNLIRLIKLRPYLWT
jgi:hypothetical protein